MGLPHAKDGVPHLPGWAVALLVLFPLLLVGFLAPLIRSPAAEPNLVVGAVLMPLNLVSILVMLWRARRVPSERKGWALMGIGVGLMMLSNAILVGEGPFKDHLSAMDAAYASAQALALVFQAWAFHAWPWSRDDGRRQGLSWMASLLFAGSFLLFSLMVLAWTGRTWPLGPLEVRLLAAVTRTALLVGLVTRLLVLDFRRGWGPLGRFFWGFLAAIVAMHVAFALHQDLAQGLRLGAPLFTLYPLTFIWAAASPRPMEVPEGSPLRPVPLGMAAIFVPLALEGLLLCLLSFQRQHPLSLPILGFVLLSWLLLILQFVLVRELSRTKRTLEDRIQERTAGLQRAQALLLRTERMNSLAMLGAGLAHDLNNSLGVILGHLDLLGLDLKRSGVPAPRGLEQMATALEQSAGLTQRLMSFARQGVEAPVPVDLNQEAERLEGLVRMLLPRNVRLVLSVDKQPLKVLASPGRVEQILVNLVGNARDALPEGGLISVTLRRSGGSAVLVVSDTGCGIPPELQERVFEPLFTTKGPGKGTGLGLSSVRTLVEELGGSLVLESAAGAGATFVITLPLLAGEAGGSPDQPAPAATLGTP